MIHVPPSAWRAAPGAGRVGRAALGGSTVVLKNALPTAPYVHRQGSHRHVLEIQAVTNIIKSLIYIYSKYTAYRL